MASQQEGSEIKLNLNSYLSISVIGIIVTVTLWINSQFNDVRSKFSVLDAKSDTAKSEMNAAFERAKSNVDMKFQEVSGKVEKLDTRVGTLENASKSSSNWTAVDMFKWAVRLQRDNPTVKVPEPVHQNE